MTWVLDPADPVVAAWLRGEQAPDPAQRCGQRRRRLSEAERQRRLVEARRRETERQRRRRHARALAEGREPGRAGTPGHGRRA